MLLNLRKHIVYYAQKWNHLFIIVDKILQLRNDKKNTNKNAHTFYTHKLLDSFTCTQRYRHIKALTYEDCCTPVYKNQQQHSKKFYISSMT